MIRKLTISLLLMALCMSVSGQKKSYDYVDAAELNVIGKVLPSSMPFARLDTTVYKFDDKLIMSYCCHSTGLAVLFRTDSRNIKARWVTSEANAGSNLTAIVSKGLDLYIRENGKWVFAGIGSPNMKQPPHDEHESLIVGNMPEGIKECLMYLPLFDKVESLEIGVDEGASIEPIENPFKHKIVFKGSSITHGASASRPGMSYPARFGRDNGFYVCNLGFSGSSKLQEEFAHVLADTQADAFILDVFSNPQADVIYEKFDEFVDIIRATHPETPLIFLQTERRETRNFNTGSEEKETAKQKAAEEVVRRRMRNDKNIYFIDSKDFLGDDHVGTIDGTHPNDIGFSRMLDVISPVILEILEGYGIR